MNIFKVFLYINFMNNPQDLLNSSHAELLKNLFDDIDSNHDRDLTFDELSAHLSKKSGRAFNNELLAEIFRTMDKDRNSIITLNEFLEGYDKAENLISSQISQLKDQIDENNEGLLKTKKNMYEAQAKKIQHKAENNLYITVAKAEGLKSWGVTGNKAPCVYITCESHEIQTVPIPNPSNPEWNQSFTFPISQGIGDILIEVYDTERGIKSNFLGEVSIPLIKSCMKIVCN